MIDLLSIAAAGLSNSVAQVSKAAIAAAHALTTGSGGSLADAVVAEAANGAAVKAEVAVMKTADKMMGTLLDTLA
jgi:hypothetical protein